MDTGKAISLVAAHGGNSWDYTERQNEKVLRPPGKGLPILVVPTTAGTGSETTSFAVINNPAEKRKCAIISEAIYPSAAIIDPLLTVSMSPEMTALTGLDTFAHALEAFISVNANEIVEMMAITAIELFARNIRVAVKTGSDLKARGEMAIACALGGASISHAGVCLPHALGQPLGAITDAPHGGTLAACLPQVVAWTIPAAQDKFARVSRILNSEQVKDMDVSQQAQALPSILRTLYDDLEVNVSFSKYGLQVSQIETLTDLVFNGFYQDILCHPRQATREDILFLVKECMQEA
jgi:alcohol dehydrogenase class IV